MTYNPVSPGDVGDDAQDDDCALTDVFLLPANIGAPWKGELEEYLQAKHENSQEEST